MLHCTDGMPRPPRIYVDPDSPLFDIRLLHSELVSSGHVRLTIDVFAYPGPNSMDRDSLYRLQLLWRRNSNRKSYRPLKLTGRVVPEQTHSVDVVVADDWVVGVKHRHVYQVDVDMGFHGIASNEFVEISSRVELITVLDYLSMVP